MKILWNWIGVNERNWRKLWQRIRKVWEIYKKGVRMLKIGGLTYIWRWIILICFFKAEEK